MSEPRRVRIAEATYGEREIEAVTKVLREQPLQLVDGPHCAAFEARAAAAIGVEHAVLVNSGSSANLLALAALELPAGSEVITPALTFGTTVAPLLQLGLVPVFVDVAPGRLVPTDMAAIAAAVSPTTSALMMVDLVGDVPDWAALRELADRHELALIEDACDTFAPGWDGGPAARFADVCTTSFYASHMLTTGGIGGMVGTHDAALATRIRLLRGWGRRSAGQGEPEAIVQRQSKVAGAVYDTKYTFDVPGYNFLPSELGAAFGLIQLDRMAGVRVKRAAHVARLTELLARWPGAFEVPVLPERAQTTWHAFVFQVLDASPVSRDALRAGLEARGIQTRMVLTGNITGHPMVRDARHRVVGTLGSADAWMARGLMIGCHQGLTEADLVYVAGCFEDLMGAP